MEKTGWGQLGIVLALSRIFSEAANFPSHDIHYGMQRFTVIIASYLLLSVTLLPVFTAVKQGRSDIYSGTAGKSAAAVLIIYLTAASVITTTRLQFYASSTIFDVAPPWLLILFVSIVCLYGLFKGISAVTRTGVIVAAIFLLLLIIVIIGVSKNITLHYLYPAITDNTASFFREVMSEFSKNAEIAIFAALFPTIRKGAVKSLYLCLPLSAGVMLLMTFLYNTVLGEYLNTVNFPFYMLSSLSDISVLQRLDGIDVTVWIMSAVIKISLIIIAVYNLSLNIFRKKKAAYITTAASLAVSSLSSYFFSTNTDDFLDFAGIMETGLPLVLATVPLITASVLIKPKGIIRDEKA